MTKTKIINETVEFYSADTSRRATNPGGSCSYSIKILNDEERNCAVGRCMTGKALEVYGHQIESVYGLDRKANLDTLLRKKYHGHEVNFWTDLQRLHDSELNWQQNGLTETGKSLVIQLLETYKD